MNKEKLTKEIIKEFIKIAEEYNDRYEHYHCVICDVCTDFSCKEIQHEEDCIILKAKELIK